MKGHGMPTPSLSEEFTPAIITAWIDESIKAETMTAGSAKGYRRGARLLIEHSASLCGISLEEEIERQALANVMANGAPKQGADTSSVTEYLLANTAHCVQAFTDHLYMRRCDRRKAQELISQLRRFCAWLKDRGWTSLDASSIENPIVMPQLVTLPIVRMWASEWVATGRVKPLTAQNYRNAAMQFALFVGGIHRLQVHMVHDRKALERMLEAVKTGEVLDAPEPETITDWLCGSRTKASIDSYLRHLQQSGTPSQEGTVIVSNLRMFIEWLSSVGLTELKPEDVKNPFSSGKSISVHPIVGAWLSAWIDAGRLSTASSKNYERKVRALIDALAQRFSVPMDPQHESNVFDQIRSAAPEAWEPPPDTEDSLSALICLQCESSIPPTLQALADEGSHSQVIMNQIASAVRKLLEYLRDLEIPGVDPAKVETPIVPHEAEGEPKAPTEAHAPTAVDTQVRPETAKAHAPPSPTKSSKPRTASTPKAPAKKRSTAKSGKKAASKAAGPAKKSSPRPKVHQVIRMHVPRRGIPSGKGLGAAIASRNDLIDRLIRDEGITFAQIRDWRFEDFDPSNRTLTLRDRDGNERAWQPGLETLSALTLYYRKILACSLDRVWNRDNAPLFLSADGGELTVDDQLKPNTQEWTTSVLRDTVVTQLVIEGFSFEEVINLRMTSLVSLTPGLTTSLQVLDSNGAQIRRQSIGAQATDALRSYMEALRVIGHGLRDSQFPLLIAADAGTLTADDIL